MAADDPQLLHGAAFLQGGGTMGELIRAFDWAATPLGPPDHWPLPLRTTVRILLTTGHPAFIFWGPELRCFYNDAYSRSIGPEKHPGILGGPGRDAWPEIWDIIGPQIEYVMAAKGATWHENALVPIIRHGRKEDVYWTYSYSPIDEPGSPHGVGGVLVLCTETTEQVKAAERLKAAEGRWRQLFDQAPGFMCVLSGPQHVFEFATPSYFRLVGREDILGRSVSESLPWAAEQGYTELLDGVYRTGQPFLARSATMVRPTSPGQPDDVRYVDFVYQPIRDETGNINGIFCLGSDVTERHQAESALRASEARLRVACEAADLGIHDLDLESGTISWDARIRGLWGIGLDEPVTYGDVFLGGLHPDDRAATDAQLARAMNPAGDGRYLAEYRVINRVDGVMRWVQSTGRVAFDGLTARRLVGTVQDITERKLADTRRIEFLATLGHELRNPLAPISNSLELLRRSAHSDEASRRAQDVIARQLKHMVRLLEDLLDVVRITTGRIDLRRETIALDDVIQLALEAAAPQVERGRHDVSRRGSDQAVYVHADPVRLAQVFSNLLINACKYSDSGSPIALTIEPRDGTVTVRVTDEGIGIGQEDLSRVFEMFSQSGPSLERAEGGLGIGLSLARGLVELHGGSIEVKSEGMHRGSEFIVHLPTHAAPAGGTDRLGAERAIVELDGIRVLVVDDNGDAASTLATLLRMQGAAVAIGRDGMEALETAETFKPQIILLDIGLPKLNGYEVCRRLRLRPWAKLVRIVALTGWGQETDRSQSREAGFDAHLVKPVDYDALMRAIAET